MAKEKKEQDKTQEEPKKKSKLKLIIILLVALGLLGGGGYFAYKKFFATNKQTTQSSKEKDAKKEEKKKDKKNKGEKTEEQPPQLQTSLVQLPTIIVNLADPLGKRYLKVSIEIEVKGKDPENLVKEKMPIIKDTLIMLLSSKSYDEISSLEKKYALKMEIAQRLNQIFEKPIVTKVYFTDFLVQ